MAARILLIVIQLLVAWFAAPQIMKFVPHLGVLNTFILAFVFAILVWVIGVVFGTFLKDVGQPSPSALVVSFGLAVVMAALVLMPAFENVILNTPAKDLPRDAFLLIGAVLGCTIKR